MYARGWQRIAGLVHLICIREQGSAAKTSRMIFSVSGMLATRISYINDLTLVAEKLGIDIEYVRQG
ncbi:hypothetical protein EKL28_18590, partial [Staphylococcus aureus]